MAENEAQATSPKLNLAAKIAKIAAEIGPIAKDGENKEQNYNFIEHAAVSAAITKAQFENGIAVFPTVESFTVDEVTSKYGALGYHYILNMKFKVVNVDDPSDCFEATWLGESTDYGDKGINKAGTSGEKYFLMKLYHISDKSSNDPDADTPAAAVSPHMSQQQIEQANPKKPEIDFKKLSNIRRQLINCKSVSQLEAYRKKLNLDDKHWSLVKKDFSLRKQQIEQANPKKPEEAEDGAE